MTNREYNITEELNNLREKMKYIPKEFHDLLHDVIYAAELTKSANRKLEEANTNLQYRLYKALERYYNLKWGNG